MVIIIEIDKHWTVGIDILKRVYGVRLGFIAVHLVLARLEELENAHDGG